MHFKISAKLFKILIMAFEQLEFAKSIFTKAYSLILQTDQ